MRFPMRQWLMIVAVLAGLGMLRVAQQTAIWQAAYRTGAAAERLHALENETAWLRTEVLSLHSPTRLAGVMRGRRDKDKLVAWSELPKSAKKPARLAGRSASSGTSSPPRPPAGPPARSQVAQATSVDN